MDPVVVGKLGVKGGGQHRILAYRHRLPVVQLGQHLDTLARPLNDRRPDKDAAKGGPLYGLDVQVSLEAVDLTAEGVSG